MKVNWNIIKGLLLLGLVVFLYGFSHHKHDARKVTNIAVEFEQGNNLFMNYEMVNKLLIQKGKTVKNEAKTVIDLQKLEKNVLSHSMVEDASVFLTVDGLLKTIVKQRTPIARVISHGQDYYIDKQAKKMPLSDNYSARVILVSGNITDNDIDDIYHLISKIIEDDFLKKQIIGVRKIANKEFVLNMRIGEQEIEIGNLENLNLKFQNLKAFFNKTMADKTIEDYKIINLKYNNQVVCTKK
ncbi:cell division protein FtsQ/DivIB [Lutibacter citreus]|uniref:cell division protein FtsQ/DivIB n=1 Tax=Lutibacter citreus TaxID=2138210 RepID=UPI000DBE96E4|nr:cell division protein FtsQ [Lutibacter citreus]